MKKVFKILLVTVLGISVVVTGLFFRWRHQENGRLQAGSQVIQTSKGPIEYSTFGEGPAVLVLHGTIGGYDQAEQLAKMVDTEAYQFINVSRPGYLQTPLETGPTFAEQADAYAALLDELGIDQVAVMGISGGGPPTMQFALRHPERTWGIIMIAANSDVEIARASREATTENSPPPEWIIHIIFSDFTSWLATTGAKWWPEQFLPAVVGEAYVETVINDPQKYEIYTGFVDSFSLNSQRYEGSFNDGEQFPQYTGHPYETIQAPMLILQGTEDLPSMDAEQRHLAEIVPNAQYIAIEGGTHFMPISHNDILAPLIQEFLAKNYP